MATFEIDEKRFEIIKEAVSQSLLFVLYILVYVCDSPGDARGSYTIANNKFAKILGGLKK